MEAPEATSGGCCGADLAAEAERVALEDTSDATPVDTLHAHQVLFSNNIDQRLSFFVD